MSVKGVTILMKIVMVYLIVMKMKLEKIINFSWLMIAMIIFWMVYKRKTFMKESLNSKFV